MSEVLHQLIQVRIKAVCGLQFWNWNLDFSFLLAAFPVSYPDFTGFVFPDWHVCLGVGEEEEREEGSFPHLHWPF